MTRHFSIGRLIAVTLGVLTIMIGPSVGRLEAFSLLGGYTGPVEFHLSGRDTAAIYPALTLCAGAATCDGFQVPVGTPIPGGTAGTVNAKIAGEDGWGILRISNITTPGGGTILWADGQNGDHLSGIFFNVQDIAVTPLGGGVQDIRSTGVGASLIHVLIYDLAATATLGTPAARTAPGVDPDVTGTPAQLFLAVDLVPGGAVLGDPVSQLDANFNTNNSTGSSVGFGNIIGGFGASLFGAGQKFLTTNNPGTTADLSLRFDTLPTFPGVGGAPPVPGEDCTATPATCSSWTVFFNDPVIGTATRVPEPGSLFLLGAALLGFAGTAYLKRKKS